MEKEKITSLIHYRVVAILSLVAVGFISLGFLYYHYEAQRIRDDKFEDLSTIAKLKADFVQEWRGNRLADVRRVPGPLVKREMARLLQDPTNPSARAALQIQLNINRKATVYADALFLDTRGNILLSDNPNPAPVDQATMKAIEVALKDRKEFLSDFFRDPEGIIYIDAVTPIPDNTGRPIAIVVLRSKAADSIYPFIQSWPTPSKTGETLLVCRDGDFVLFLNELRNRSNTALTLRFPLTDTNIPGVQAVLHNYGMILGRDYRGVDVLAVTRPIPESSWSIVAKTDAEEILEEVKYRAKVVSIIVFLLILISAGLIMSVYRNRREVERKRVEETLRESEKRYRELTNFLPISIFEVDAAGSIISFNRTALEVFRYNQEDYKEGMNALQFFAPEEWQRVGENMGRVIQGTSIPGQEFTFLRKDGGTFIGLIYASPNIHENKTVGIIGAIIDITERNRAEEEVKKYSAQLIEKNEELRAMTQQLWQTAKLATMGELSASIAHELNNPLATVSLRIGSLQERMVADNHDRRDLEIIAQEVERMGNLVANLLQFSRRSPPQISTVDLCDEIEKTLELIYYHLRKNNISIMRQFASDVPRIHADRQQLRQLFLNLFTNASDSMLRGGTLTIRMTAPPESMQVIIEVADTGTGIPPEILPKAAEPFYTTKPVGEGTGLGLAICRRVVQEHNGTFDLTSEGIPGKGTTARISLPVTHRTISASLKNQ